MKILDTNRKFICKHHLFTDDSIWKNNNTGDLERWSAHIFTGTNTLTYKGRELEFVEIIH